jgi:AraC-like DNA-binding protein
MFFIEAASPNCYPLNRLTVLRETRLNEHAANSAAGEGLLPIWHLDKGRALFAGPLRHNSMHAHSVPVMVTGLYGPFRFRLAPGRWQRCAAAVIPAGTPYEFDAGGEALAVIYLEPSVGRADTLVPLLSDCAEADGAVTGVSRLTRELRLLYEAPNGGVGGMLDDFARFSQSRARREIDRRIAHAIAMLSSSADETVSVVDVAQRAGLSASRFQHLFVEHAGVPFRRFRGWQRLRRAISAITSGASFTHAAHDAGFADLAHFSRSFRQTFGAPASPSLRKVRSE